MRSYNMTGPGGVTTLTPQISDHVFSLALSAGNPKTVNWPDGSQWLNITGDGNDYYISVTGAASIPPEVDVVNGTASAKNTSQRQRGEENSFSVVSPVDQILTIEFWG